MSHQLTLSAYDKSVSIDILQIGDRSYHRKKSRIPENAANFVADIFNLAG